MASVNFLKLKTSGDVSAMLRHDDMQERKDRSHANPDLDKHKTPNNTALYGLSYDKAFEKYKDRIQALDDTTNRNRRKDRVTCFSLEFTVPQDFTEKADCEDFFSRAEALIAEQYGQQNIVESYHHYDEIHDYIDNGVRTTSRAHAHVLVVPEIDGQLNGKAFSSRKAIMALNKAIDDMCLKEYGKSYMTGQEARHKSAERLKAESVAKARRRALEGYDTQDGRHHMGLYETECVLEQTTDELEALKAEMQAQKAEIEHNKAILSAQKSQIDAHVEQEFPPELLKTWAETSLLKQSIDYGYRHGVMNALEAVGIKNPAKENDIICAEPDLQKSFREFTNTKAWDIQNYIKKHMKGEASKHNKTKGIER